MVSKIKAIRADDKEEIDKWEKAAKTEKEDGNPSFNHWARKLLNREMRRIFKKNGIKL